MEHHGSLPKHLQISELLIREVVAGRLADGARLVFPHLGHVPKLSGERPLVLKSTASRVLCDVC